MFFEKLLESIALLHARPRPLFMQTSLMFSASFVMTFMSLSYSWTQCRTKIPDNQLFFAFLALNIATFLGSLLSPTLTRRFDVYHVQFASLCVLSAGPLLFSIMKEINSLGIILTLIGFAVGVAYCSIPHTFIRVFPEDCFSPIHILYLFNSLGGIVGTLFYRTTTEPSCLRENDSALEFTHKLSSNKYYIVNGVGIESFFSCFLVILIPLLYALLTSKLAVKKTEQRREEYEDIEAEQREYTSIKVVYLCATMACVASLIHSLFPFLILAHRGGVVQYLCYTAASVLGRLVAAVTVDKVAPYFYMGLCIIGCGAASSVLVFDEALLLGSVTLGIFLPGLLPSLLVYVKNAHPNQEDRVFPLLCGSSFGFVVFPLFLVLSNISESRVFIVTNFFAVILLVLLFVYILNLQAHSEPTAASQDAVKIFIDRFFSGEAMLKRTRSIRPLISRLRPNSYRRFRGRKAADPEVNVEEVPQATPMPQATPATQQ